MKLDRECDRLAARADDLLCDFQQGIYRRTDRLSAMLLAIEWPVLVIIALCRSPYTWDGAHASIHPHLLMAVGMGALVCGVPAMIAWRFCGHTATRYLVSVAQMGCSSLLIHLLGGRIEAHFHVFLSLIFLAAYRDWKVLVPATAFIAVDHLLRGFYWPWTVFGVASATPWRAVEHAVWVLATDVALVINIQRSRNEMRSMSEQTAHLENSHDELRRYSEQLTSSYDKEREIIEGALDAVVQIDQQGRVVSWNSQAEKTFGWTPAEALARPIEELIVPRELREQHQLGMRRYLETGEGPVLNQRRELEALRRDGTKFPIEIAVTPITCGQEPLFCAFIRDITSRKTFEENLKQAKDQAEAANRTKSEFLANMSHEIRTPLNGILGFTELLIRDETGDEAERRDYIRTIRTSGKHLLELINDILDLSKIEAGQLQVETTTCSPHHLIAEVVSVLRARAQEKAIDLEYRWDSEIPESIQSDPYRLRQLLMNLVGNAVKFTERGSVNIVARIVPDGQQSRFELEVRDTGIGIDAAQLNEIFKPFVQADNSVTRRFGGTGLGLTITKNICDSLGGSLKVDSTVGVGSTFTVVLPAGDLSKVRLGVRPPVEGHGDIVDTREGAANLAGVRVLLADDGETNRKLINLFLTRQGAEVTTAENGELAVAAAREHEFDVVLMDMQMPVMDGYAATRKLRSLGFTRPILALTAHAMLGDRRKCEEAGCSGYLTKPVNVDELVRVLQASVRQRSPNEPGAAQSSTPAGAEVAVSNEPIHSALPTDDDEIRELVAEFTATIPERIEAMQQALALLDYDSVAAMAHALKGAGGTAGYDCLTDVSSRIEKCAKDKDQDGLAPMLNELRLLNDRILV